MQGEVGAFAGAGLQAGHITSARSSSQALLCRHKYSRLALVFQACTGAHSAALVTGHGRGRSGTPKKLPCVTIVASKERAKRLRDYGLWLME